MSVLRDKFYYWNDPAGKDSKTVKVISIDRYVVTVRTAGNVPCNNKAFKVAKCDLSEVRGNRGYNKLVNNAQRGGSRGELLAEIARLEEELTGLTEAYEGSCADRLRLYEWKRAHEEEACEKLTKVERARRGFWTKRQYLMIERFCLIVASWFLAGIGFWIFAR
jgi:hypothetical protein